jgi:hypothetical protein
VTVTDRLAVPPTPVQASVYAVVLAGETLSEPLVARVPLQPPLAVQLVALALDQVSVLDCPAVIDVGSAVSVTVGAGTTVTVVESVEVPPDPVQASRYVVVLVGDTVCEPLVARAPAQPPLAVQLVALVLVQVSVLDCPDAMDVGLAVKVMVGGTGAAVTVTVTESPVVPPVPVQVSA